jgi:hypothetical protein
VAAGEFVGRLASRSRDAGLLDAAGAMTDNFVKSTTQEVDPWRLGTTRR